MKRWIGYGLVVLLIAYLLTGTRQIKPGERAVISRWGRIVAMPGPGLWIGLPYGFDRVECIAVDSVRRLEVGFRPGLDGDDQTAPVGQLLTGDHNLVNVQIAIDYTVANSRVADYVMHKEKIDGLIGRVAESILSQWIAGHTIDQILVSAKAELPLLLVNRLQEKLEPYHCGVELQAASVSYLHPPEAVQPAFDEVTRAQASIQAREDDARQLARRRLSEAEADANRMEKLIAAYVQEHISLAHSEAEAFTRRREQYQTLSKQNPDFLNAIWWEETGKLFAKLKESGRIDLLDHHLNRDGLDVTTWVGSPDKKK